MHLKQGTLLQGGKYRIEKVLGQGGFGITYLATQDLLDRKVAIKEFFFKEYCEREGNTNTITLGTQSIKATVERFLKKLFAGSMDKVDIYYLRETDKKSDVIKETSKLL